MAETSIFSQQFLISSLQLDFEKLLLSRLLASCFSATLLSLPSLQHCSNALLLSIRHPPVISHSLLCAPHLDIRLLLSRQHIHLISSQLL